MEEQKKKNIGMAVVAYIIFFLPLLTDAKNYSFVKYHVKQGFALFVSFIVSMIISMIPFFGWIISGLMTIVLLIFFLMGISNAIQGKETALPIVGKFGEKFNF